MNNIELATHVVDRERGRNKTTHPKKILEYIRFAIDVLEETDDIKQLVQISTREWQEVKAICFPKHHITVE